MEAILFEDLPYLVLFNPPVLEVYRGDSVVYPFTDVLGGLTDARKVVQAQSRLKNN